MNQAEHSPKGKTRNAELYYRIRPLRLQAAGAERAAEKIWERIHPQTIPDLAPMGQVEKDMHASDSGKGYPPFTLTGAWGTAMLQR